MTQLFGQPVKVNFITLLGQNVSLPCVLRDGKSMGRGTDCVFYQSVLGLLVFKCFSVLMVCRGRPARHQLQ